MIANKLSGKMSRQGKTLYSENQQAEKMGEELQTSGCQEGSDEDGFVLGVLTLTDVSLCTKLYGSCFW